MPRAAVDCSSIGLLASDLSSSSYSSGTSGNSGDFLAKGENRNFIKKLEAATRRFRKRTKNRRRDSGSGTNAGSASGGEFEDLFHLRGARDRPRIARHPRRAHRLRGDAIELIPTDLHLTEAARHAEAADEAVEHVAGVLAGLTH